MGQWFESTRVRQLRKSKVKVTIGPYTNWFGPYQIAKLVFFWKKEDNDQDPDDDIVYRFGDFLSGPKDKPSLLLRFCQWLDSKKERKIKVHIDNYDVWSADHTLAFVIYPVLLKLKEIKMGSPFVDDEDVPEHLRSTNAQPKVHEYDTDEFHDARWDYVLDEMIWAFEQHKIGEEWMEQYTSGTIDLSFEKEEGTTLSKLVQGPNHTYTRAEDKIANHRARMDNGRRLFAKYYESLWH